MRASANWICILREPPVYQVPRVSHLPWQGMRVTLLCDPSGASLMSRSGVPEKLGDDDRTDSRSV